MLILPYLAGLLAGDPRWVHIPLLLAWLLGYLGSYFIFLSLKSRRPQRYRRQMLAYLTPAALLALLVVVAVPAFVLAAPVFVGCWAVNAWYAWRRDERSLVNDFAAVVMASAVGPVAYYVGGGTEIGVGAVVALIPLLYFSGTIFFVKTMIRERGNVAYYRASIAFHAAATVAAALVHPMLGVLFLALLVRAAMWPRVGATPLQIGLVEIVASVLVLVGTVAVA